MKIKGDMQNMQDITLRNQIKDVLKYLRKTDRYCLERQTEEVVLGNLCTNAGLVDLSSLMQEYGNGDSSKVFIRGYSAEDYDGYPEGYIEISTERNQTDEEYFEYLCRILLPTDYQLKQYKEYLRLKEMFESTTGKD